MERTWSLAGSVYVPMFLLYTGMRHRNRDRAAILDLNSFISLWRSQRGANNDDDNHSTPGSGYELVKLAVILLQLIDGARFAGWL